MAEAKSTGSRSTGSNASQADVQAQIDQLRDDISKLTKTISDLGNQKAEEVRGRAEERLGEARSRAEKFRDDASKAGHDAYERARDEALSLEEDLEDRIRERPVQSLMLAAGVGFLAALLTRR